MKIQRISSLLFLFLLVFYVSVFSQEEKKQDDIYKGLKFRNIGPALTSGRIADIAIHPKDESTWYIAVGSGAVYGKP